MTKKLLVLLTILLQVNLSYAQSGNEVLTIAEQMPYFMGCEDLENGTEEKRQCSNQNLINFINRNIQYPQAARDAGLEGTVLISFVINAFGEMEQAQILRDIGGDCGKEALRILSLMPEWEPAIHEGKTVAVRMNLPITFELQNLDKVLSDKYQIQWGTLRGRTTSKEELQQLINKKLIVRDEMGNEIDISRLTFIFQRRRAYCEESSTGIINKKMQKVLKKVKKGGTFIIIVEIQKDGEIQQIEQVYEIKA